MLTLKISGISFIRHFFKSYSPSADVSFVGANDGGYILLITVSSQRQKLGWNRAGGLKRTVAALADVGYLRYP